ncbi:hypothetical protein jhhlp_001594 [Lomentospora prolificans]|uniref:Uncharacterized protein n=1 Tax=Lomentospora prolificans TaxID=41688 RepID=A0A2N3NIN6_9PEZI|nr:hypothetical protein jhhlp_001594 [Lomentospora prolificans]
MEPRKAFRRAVRKATRAFWNEKIGGVKDANELYKMVGWHKLGERLASPPISHKGQTFLEDQQKAQVLRRAKLSHATGIEDIADPWAPPIVPPRLIAEDTPIQRDEVFHYTAAVESIAVGGDNIRVLLL